MWSPCEVGFKRHHPGAGEQHCGVAGGHEGRAGHDRVALFLEELQESTPDLVSVHGTAFAGATIRFVPLRLSVINGCSGSPWR